MAYDCIEAIGLFAGALSCVSFVPQILKLTRQRDASGVSRRMYVVTVTAFALWLAYGLAHGRPALIAGNGICLLLAAAILALKIWRDRQGRADGHPATTTE
jgi:MtN3 and saliva related transmembrane protein